MRPARICFYGLFGQGNLGNECTLQAILHHVRQYFPDAELLCICTDPNDTAARHHVPAIPISRRYLRNGDPNGSPSSRSRVVRWLSRVLIGVPRELLDWIQAVRTLKGKDMLIVPGTGLLTDFCSSPLGWPYDIFKWSLISRLCGCKLVFVSVGAGPLYRPLSRWLVKSALSLATFRSYRDGSTMDYLTGLGFSRAGDRVSPDLAFSLPRSAISSAGARQGERRVIGIGLMNDPGKLSTDKPTQAMHAAYLEKLADFAGWSLAHGYDVRLLIGDFAYDREVTDQFRQLLKARSVVAPGRIDGTTPLSVEQLLSQLAETDVVIATRFHNVVLALLLGKPVIALSFHHKCASLMEGMGLSEYSQDMSDLDLAWLIEQLGRLERNVDGLRTLTRERSEEYRNVLDEQYRVIFRDLGSRARTLSATSSALPTRPASDA